MAEALWVRCTARECPEVATAFTGNDPAPPPETVHSRPMSGGARGSWVLRRMVLCGLALGAVGCAGAQRPRIAAAYRFTCDPPDARVVLDETDEGPCVVWHDRWLGVTPGPHRLQITRAGYLPYEADIQPAGRRETVDVHLRPIPD